MKKLSKLVYVLGMSALTLTVSCGNEVDTDRVSPEANKNKTIEEIAEVVPSAEDLEKFAKEVATTSVAEDLVAAGTLATNLMNPSAAVASLSSEMINAALKSTGDLTVREILANSNQNINDFASTASGIAYTGAANTLNAAGNTFVNTLETADKASTEFWASFANYFGLAKSE